MDGFKKKSPRTGSPPTSPAQALDTPARSTVQLDPIDEPASDPQPPQLEMKSRRHHHPRRWAVLVATLVLIVMAALIAWKYWYEASLQPVNSSDNSVQHVEISDGMSFSQITTLLKNRGLIRDGFIFDMYARIHGQRERVKAGTCVLMPSESVAMILDKLVAGCHDFTSITFYPGSTIEQPKYKPQGAVIDQTKMSIRSVLVSAGYSEAAVDAGLSQQYSSPLFADKPANTTLEGYVYGETYYVDRNASVSDVLTTTFAQMYKVLQQNDIITKYQSKGLNLYQGITLASIVQRELNCEGKSSDASTATCYANQQKIAQIFLTRLQQGIPLGSDVTFIYAADMMGVTPSPTLDSPYNTRRYTGLPPGPVSSPGLHALEAVANPASTDYLYFIAGDDGMIYFAKTEQEHQQNIQEHCQVLCSQL